MADFLELSRGQRQVVDDLTSQLVRVQIHIKRNELRAATRRIESVFQEIEYLKKNNRLPGDYMLVGANLGLLSGKREFVRGKLPAVLLGVAGGWLFGQSISHKLRTDLDAIQEHALFLLEGIARQTRENAAKSEGANL